jgi:hypothetical protein
MASKKGGGKARSAITGRYVKKSYAKKHPKTTIVHRKKAAAKKAAKKKPAARKGKPRPSRPGVKKSGR